MYDDVSLLQKVKKFQEDDPRRQGVIEQIVHDLGFENVEEFCAKPNIDDLIEYLQDKLQQVEYLQSQEGFALDPELADQLSRAKLFIQYIVSSRNGGANG